MLYKRELPSDLGRAFHYGCTFTALKQTNPFASWDSNATEELDGIQCPFTDFTTNVSAQ